MFKKKEKTEKAPNNKKVSTMKVGTHKKSVLLLWAVLAALLASAGPAGLTVAAVVLCAVGIAIHALQRARRAGQ